MEITNVRIKNVTVGLDSRHNLSARMTFETSTPPATGASV